MFFLSSPSRFIHPYLKESLLNLIALVIFVTLAALLLIKLNFSILLATSFLLNLLITLILSLHTTNPHHPLSLPSCSIVIFNFAFFIIAPIIQLMNIEYSELINTLPIIESQLIKANFIIFIFTFFYLFFRINLKRYLKIKLGSIKNNIYSDEKILILMLAIFMPFFILNGIELTKYFSGIGAYNSNSYSSIVVLFLVKFIYVLPIFFTALIISQYSNKYNLIILITCLLVCVFFKNPFIENRSGFGLALLILLWISIKNFLNSNSRLIYALLIVIFILFPIGEIISIYRNSHISSFDKFFHVFNTVHYDAWANGVGIIDLVEKKGLQNGNQLLGSLLFWFPREIWTTKPIATGQLLGEYLIENYHHWMSNISSPLMFEGYVDFGYLGVILFALLISIVSHFLDLIYSSKNDNLQILSTYIGLSYFFVLRGPLLSSFAYTSGGIASICLGIWLVNKFCLKKE